MKGKRWPQGLMGVIILVIGLMAVRHGMADGDLRFYGTMTYGGAGSGSALPVDPKYIVWMGLGIVVLGIHVIHQAFR
ncbi:MAG: hypothetical protein ACK4SX_13235 [Alcanivoracaceae bacterium]